MGAEEPESEEFVEARCYFVRGRNALAVRADFGVAYMDHYLHLMQHGIRLDPGPDASLKDALAALTSIQEKPPSALPWENACLRMAIRLVI